MKRGNADFLAGTLEASPTDEERRAEIAQEQSPFAVLVGCADSRVAPELLFSVGLGELFTVRNAGNTIDAVALGSVEYGVLVLGAPLILVLGHQRCGAVEAAVAAVREGETFPGNIGALIEPIIPSVVAAVEAGVPDGEELVDAVVRDNVRRTVERLRSSEPSLHDALQAGALRVVGAEYSLDEGRVDFFLE